MLNIARETTERDSVASITLAEQALQQANIEEDNKTLADTHCLLAELHLEKKNHSQAKYHFNEAIRLYENETDTHRVIVTLIDYSKLLIRTKAYQQAAIVIKKLMKEAKAFNDNELLGMSYNTEGDFYYKQKMYEQAVKSYRSGVPFISAGGDKTRKILANTFHQIAQCYKHLRDIPQSIHNYQKALEIHQSLGDTKHIAKAMKNIAMSENRREAYVRALEYGLRSHDMQRSLNNSKDYAQITLLVGIIYRNIGHYSKSLDYIQAAQKLYKQIESTKHVAESSNQLGLIYTRLKQFDNAMPFYLNTIEMPDNLLKPETKGAAYREIGVIHQVTGDYDNAMKMFKKSLAIYQPLKAKKRIAQVELLMGTTYLKLDNSLAAKRQFNKSLELARQIDNKEFQISALNSLSRVALDTDEDRAISLAKQAIKLSDVPLASTELLASYELLKQAEKQKGNLDSALTYADLEIKTAEAISRSRIEEQLVQAKAKLELHKFEIDLKALREQIELDSMQLAKKNNEIKIARQLNQISELELSKNRYAAILLAVLLLIFLLIAILFYRAVVTARRRTKELDHLAARDPLTNCYNRRALFKRLKNDFKNLTPSKPYSLILADIDHFKKINDTHGHNQGDSVIQGVSRLMQESVRQHDTVARFGGEEFCILLPNVEVNQAMRIAESIRVKIQTLATENISVTCSFGVTCINDDTQSINDLLEKADTALYQSKKRGRNKVSLHQKPLSGEDR